MKIAFDAKRAFHNKTGLGNYSRSVINTISNTLKSDQIYLFTPSVNNNFKIPNHNTNIVTPSIISNKIYWRFKGINRQLEKLNIDIYHGLSNEIPHGINTKSIVTIHDLLFLKYPNYYNFIDRKIYYLKSKFACKKASHIIATSKQTKEDIIRFFKIKESKIHVIYQSCDDEFIYPSNHEIKDKILKKQTNKPYILYVGRIEERKNLLFLLKAMNKTQKEVHLICVGNKTKYYKKIHQYISINKLQNRITFMNVNNTKTLSFLYRKSRGLVFPSLDEGFGIPIIEGMYSKIPVVTSNKAIFKEIGGESSYYFQENNIDSLVQKISEIWIDSSERKKRIQLNLKYVQKFSSQQQVEKIIDIYKMA